MRGVALLVLLAAFAGTPFHDAEAGSGVSYGPVPPGIAAVVGNERDQALSVVGLATLDRARGDHHRATSLLILLDDFGLQTVARRLAAGRVPPQVLPHLLEVVASSEHPEADVLLARAAKERRPVLRMIAADGLGRGRSPAAVPVLAALAADPVPGVRIAALRSLFAIESPQAVAARMSVAADSEPALLARRLLWHRRCEDVSPGLLDIATRAYLHGTTVDLRMAAAAYLSMPRAQTPVRRLRTILLEMGTNPVYATLLRKAQGQPTRGYEPAAMRRIAIEAALTLLGRSDVAPDVRTRLLHTCVAWIADPVEMDSWRKDPIPEHRLRRRLPDLGPEIVAPVVQRLRRGDFDEPRAGVILLRELGPEIALPALRGLLAPRAQRPAFESRAEAQRRRYLRNAAAGILHELGQVGDESLARALLLGDEDTTLKIDILLALRNEPGAWAVPLLAEVVARYEGDLRSYALDVLEERPEPEARALLVEDLFARMDQPHDRLRPLVHEGDDPAIETIQRALDDKRPYMRKAGLSQFLRRTNPRLCGPKGRAVLVAYDPMGGGGQEIQAYVYALLNTDPERAVGFVAANWNDFPRDGVRMTCLRILGEAYGPVARKAAMDLALLKATPEAPMQMLMSIAAVLSGPAGSEGGGGYGWTYRTKAIGAFWKRLLWNDDVRLQREAIKAYTHEQAPDVAPRLLALLELALASKALPEAISTVESEQDFARLCITALQYQDWKQVEAKLIDVAIDPLVELNTRQVAAQALRGRLSDAGRARLLTWLAYVDPAAKKGEEKPQGSSANSVLQLFLAAAIGQDGGPTIAAQLHARLTEELFAFYSTERMVRLVREGPAALEEHNVNARVQALARGIGQTGHVPTIEALFDLIFDLRFALYAQTCVRRQGTTVREASASAAAVTPSSMQLLTHGTTDSWFGMPRPVYNLLYETKGLDDEILARALERVLDAARKDGRLAHFPPLYLHRVLMNLLEPHTGRKPKSAAVVLRHAKRTGRLDAPQHFQLAFEAVTWLAEAGRFADAAKEQARAVRIIARGNHDDAQPGLWRYHRAVQDALEGAAAAQRGEEARAAALCLQGSLRAPGDPNVQNAVAWYRALADVALEQAEVEARHATRLEARVENRPGPNAADTLAFVLLKRGKAREGLRVLGPRMREPTAVRNGLFYFHMGQLQTAAGRLRSARDALVEALTWDRALEPILRSDPHLEPLRSKVTIDEIERRAKIRRLEEQLP